MTDFTKNISNVADDDRDLEQRINSFLWGGLNTFGATLDELLSGPFSGFKRTAIVGGMVRDIARGDAFNSDIDIVIDATNGEVADVAALLGARSNAFGGWTARRGDVDIDFWALESTWAVRTGLVEARSMDDFPKTTFFTHDAAFFDLASRRVVSDKVFWNAIKRGEIEINLEPTPSIDGNLHRAVRRILNWGLIAGPLLTQFIEKYLDEAAFRKIRAIELRKGHPVLVSRFENSTELRAAVFSNQSG